MVEQADEHLTGMHFPRKALVLLDATLAILALQEPDTRGLGQGPGPRADPYHRAGPAATIPTWSGACPRWSPSCWSV